MTPLLALLLSASLLQTPQSTPQQILDQISTLLQQLKTALAPAPAPAVVADAAALTKALAAGGAITLAPGRYVGNFVVTVPKTTIAGAGIGATVLAPADPLSPALSWRAVNDVTVQGLTVEAGAIDRDAVDVGDFTVTSLAAFPQRAVLRSVAIVAPTGKGHRGLGLHAIDATVDHVTITGFCEVGRDSQALWLNGPGPYTVTNSTFEASGENILVGGADVAVAGMNPTHLVFSGNTVRKPASYRADGCAVKNSFELKTGVDVTFDGNTIDGWWLSGQASPIEVTVRNQGGAAPWAQVDAVTISHTTYTNVVGGFAVNVLGLDDAHPSQQLRTLTLSHDLFAGSTSGLQVLNGVAGALVVDHVTLPSTTDKFLAIAATDLTVPPVLTPLTFTNNVLRTGQYAITGDGRQSVGMPSLQAYASLVAFSGNVIEINTTARSFTFPAGNQVLAFGALAALLDPATYKLLAGTAGY